MAATEPTRRPTAIGFDLDEATDVLSRTPLVLRGLLQGLPEAWLSGHEGEGTWAPFDVLGHLIHGERTDWLPRALQILATGEQPPFEPFDRSGHVEWCRGRSVRELLDTFESLRSENLARLRALAIDEPMLERRGTHPEFGPVTMRQLLATWVVHDLHHIGQIVRAMARQYTNEVGPWRAFLSVLRPSTGG